MVKTKTARGKKAKKYVRKSIAKGIQFPPEVEKRILADAAKAERTFSGQVRYLIGVALKELGE